MLTSALFTHFGMPCEQVFFPRFDECIGVAGGLKESDNRLVSLRQVVLLTVVRVDQYTTHARHALRLSFAQLACGFEVLAMRSIVLGRLVDARPALLAHTIACGALHAAEERLDGQHQSTALTQHRD